MANLGSIPCGSNMDKILGKGISTIAYENENIVLLSTICPLKIELARLNISKPHLPTYQDLGPYDDGRRILAVPRYQPVKWRNERVIRDFYRRAINLRDLTPENFLDNIKRSGKYDNLIIDAIDTIITVSAGIKDHICLFDFQTKNYMRYGKELIFNDIFYIKRTVP